MASSYTMMSENVTFKVIGHRGLGPTHNLSVEQQDIVMFPENSLTAFRQVLLDGGDGIEFDIALSKDKFPVVIHDEELFKHVAKPLVDKDRSLTTDYTLEELKQFDIGGGEKIPTLTEVIELGLKEAIGRNCFFNIDLKGKETGNAVYEVLKPYFISGKLRYEDVLICSYDWDLLRHLRKQDENLQLAPCIRTKLLFGEDGVSMPGHVPIVDEYAPKAMSILQSFHRELNCSAFDSVLVDLKEPLLELALKNNIGLMFSTGNNRVDSDQTNYEMLKRLKEISSNIPFVIYKADDPLPVKQRILEL